MKQFNERELDLRKLFLQAIKNKSFFRQAEQIGRVDVHADIKEAKKWINRETRKGKLAANSHQNKLQEYQATCVPRRSDHSIHHVFPFLFGVFEVLLGSFLSDIMHLISIDERNG